MTNISILPLSDRVRPKWDLANDIPDGVTIQGMLDSAETFVPEPPPDPERGWYLTVDEAVDLMNSKYVIVLYSGKMVVFGIWQRDKNGWLRITYSSATDIKQFYIGNVLVGTNQDGTPRYKPLGEFWLAHEKATRCESVIFKPNTPAQKGVFNMWQGYACVPKKGTWALFHDHLLNNICCGNQEYYDYLIRWIARMFQHPDTPGQVAIVLKGSKGVGKGKLATIIGRIMGQHFLHISQARHLVGNFNAHLMDCVLLFVDEAFWAGDKQGESTLKTLITEEMNLFEAKGKDALMLANYLHIIIASNMSWIVPAGMDERRYFVLNVSDRRKQDKPYFTAIDVEMLENGGCEAFLHDMLALDLTGFEVRDVPKTQALLEQKIQSLQPHQHWWFEILQDGRLLPTHAEWQTEVSKRDLQEYYADTLNLAGQRHRAYSTQLGMYLKELVPSLRSTSKPPRYVFPPLDVCRDCFMKLIGAPIDWPEPEAEGNVDTDELPF